MLSINISNSCAFWYSTWYQSRFDFSRLNLFLIGIHVVCLILVFSISFEKKKKFESVCCIMSSSSATHRNITASRRPRSCVLATSTAIGFDEAQTREPQTRIQFVSTLDHCRCFWLARRCTMNQTRIVPTPHCLPELSAASSPRHQVPPATSLSDHHML